MKLIKAFTSGAIRAFRSLKALLMIWLLTFSFLALFSLPLRSFLSTSLGDTASTPLLDKALDLSYFMNLGQAFNSLLSAISGGILIVLLIFFFLYIFLNGGLFDSLRENSWSYKPGDFFRASARYFLSYLAITVLVIFMVLIALFIIIGLPLLIQGAGTSASEEATFKLLSILRIVALLVLPIFLLVADYARAWLVANKHTKVFKALGYGFKASFKYFFSSYVFMLVMLVLQALFAVLVVDILAGYSPESGGGLLLLFIISQGLFLVKLYRRAVRYGGVTALYQM